MLLQQELTPALIATETALTCRHYWIIEAAEGPVSQGVCQNCQDIKEFQNSIVDVARDY